MALDDLELNIGGQSFKGVYVAVVVSFASTIAGGIWTASEFFSRLEAQEAAVQDAGVTAATLEARFEDLRESQSTALQGYEVIISNHSFFMRTFSRRKNLGLHSLSIRTNSKKSALLGSSNASFFPAIEKPWQGEPPISKSILGKYAVCIFFTSPIC